jgi:hypothetical protein
MAQILADGTGWRLCTAATAAKADLNYYMSYRYRPLLRPYAAYFFHLWNDGREGRRTMDMQPWNETAVGAKLRVVTAQQYGDLLTGFGPTVKVTPPLDRAKFVPVKRTKKTRRLIAGVAGYVPRDGRKGERHLVHVMQSPTGRAFEWRAIGQGWPTQIRTTHLELSHLQEFYQQLDVYVCTSICEGVAYPPLEALACGIPVVIPRGVGVLDELPEISGIVRYTAGDSEDLRAALATFEHGWPSDLDRDALREATAKFTAEAWVEGHVNAFEGLCMESLVGEKVSVVLLTANPLALHVLECLRALANSSVSYQLVVVQDQEGWGFAKRVNEGLRATTGEYVLLLNDDCFVKRDTIEQLVLACRANDIGIVGGLLELPDGRVQHAGGYIDRTKPEWRMGNLKRHSSSSMQFTSDVDFVTGALLLIKRSVLDKIGPLDEGFLSTYEDVDWCLRARVAGYRVVFEPGAKAVHLESQTVRSDLGLEQGRRLVSRQHFLDKYGH